MEGKANNKKLVLSNSVFGNQLQLDIAKCEHMQTRAFRNKVKKTIEDEKYSSSFSEKEMEVNDKLLIHNKYSQTGNRIKTSLRQHTKRIQQPFSIPIKSISGSKKFSKSSIKSKKTISKICSKHKKSGKKIVSSTQMLQSKEGCVDLRSSDSVLVQTNLRDILNEETFTSLPAYYQHKLVHLLPSVDRVTSGKSIDTHLKIGMSGLNNEFFKRACSRWRDRLAEGEFTLENQQKEKVEEGKQKHKLDPWKIKHFEPIWGEKSNPDSFNENKVIPKEKPKVVIPPKIVNRTVGVVTRSVTLLREKRTCGEPITNPMKKLDNSSVSQTRSNYLTNRNHIVAVMEAEQKQCTDKGSEKMNQYLEIKQKSLIKAGNFKPDLNNYIQSMLSDCRTKKRDKISSQIESKNQILVDNEKNVKEIKNENSVLTNESASINNSKQQMKNHNEKVVNIKSDNNKNQKDNDLLDNSVNIEKLIYDEEDNQTKDVLMAAWKEMDTNSESLFDEMTVANDDVCKDEELVTIEDQSNITKDCLAEEKNKTDNVIENFENGAYINMLIENEEIVWNNSESDEVQAAILAESLNTVDSNAVKEIAEETLHKVENELLTSNTIETDFIPVKGTMDYSYNDDISILTNTSVSESVNVPSMLVTVDTSDNENSSTDTRNLSEITLMNANVDAVQTMKSQTEITEIENSSSNSQISFSVDQNKISPKQKLKGGQNGRNTLNKIPPGTVNLERSYQICQAAIQNSPNREQLKSQLKLPSSFLVNTNTTTNIQLSENRAQGIPKNYASQQETNMKSQFVSAPGSPSIIMPTPTIEQIDSTENRHVLVPRTSTASGTRRSNSAPPANVKCSNQQSLNRNTQTILKTGVGDSIQQSLQWVQQSSHTDDNTSCACSGKAMVICRMCGAFCHSECVSSNNVCINCRENSPCQWTST